MTTVPLDDGERLFDRAVAALAAGASASALTLLERALKLVDNPSWHSYLGYCIARERGQVKKGRELCLHSLQFEPENPVHYLNLAKVHRVAGQTGEALGALREGMSAGGRGCRREGARRYARFWRSWESGSRRCYLSCRATTS